ncbi:MAG: 2-phospho-L-lactate transferase [Pseudoxanthomonas sp.]
MSGSANGGVVVLSGGVGGAKLVDGLHRLLPAGSLTAIVNTGDDFVHLGLPVSPDIDTILYTLSEKSNTELGWGRQGETWSFMEAIKSLGGPDWFRLGDGDLALHVLRSMALASGESLSSITARFSRAWNLHLDIIPMSDAPVGTVLDTDEGMLAFQDYFVRRRCEPKVRSIRFEGRAAATPPPRALDAIAEAELLVIAPSNPWLSIDPILSIAPLRHALEQRQAPLIAVSPLVRNQAVKGPTAKLMGELGIEVSNHGIATHYRGLLDGLLVHGDDDAPVELAIARTDTLMHSAEDRIRVATAVLEFGRKLRQ